MRNHRAGGLAIAVMALLAGLAVGRFLTFQPDAAPAPVQATARTLGSRVAALERAVGADPADLGSWQALGIAYTQRALEVGDPAFYSLADRALARAEALDTDHPDTLLGRGHLALALHDFAAAQEYGGRALEQRPHSAEVRGVLVDAAVELGQYEAAADHLQEMLDLRPGLPALSRASYLRELHGDLPGAIEAMQRAESAGSGSGFVVATVRALLGDLHLARGDLDAAEAAYTRALDASAGLVAGEVGLARVQAAGGDTAAAIERLAALVDRFPQPDAIVLLGQLYDLAGDEVRARQHDALARTLARLQEDAGQNVDLELAVFEADRGDDRERAVQLARRAFEARPANVYAADALAWALLRSGQAQAAVPVMENALRLGTADPLLRFHAAEVFAAAGDTERARAELDAALAAGPGFPVAHRQRAGALADELGLPRPVAWEAGP